MGPELMYFRQREAELRARAEQHRQLQEARQAASAESQERKGGDRPRRSGGRSSAHASA